MALALNGNASTPLTAPAPALKWNSVPEMQSSPLPMAHPCLRVTDVGGPGVSLGTGSQPHDMAFSAQAILVTSFRRGGGLRPCPQADLALA